MIERAGTDFLRIIQARPSEISFSLNNNLLTATDEEIIRMLAEVVPVVLTKL